MCRCHRCPGSSLDMCHRQDHGLLQRRVEWAAGAATAIWNLSWLPANLPVLQGPRTWAVLAAVCEADAREPGGLGQRARQVLEDLVDVLWRAQTALRDPRAPGFAKCFLDPALLQQALAALARLAAEETPLALPSRVRAGQLLAELLVQVTRRLTLKRDLSTAIQDQGVGAAVGGALAGLFGITPT